MTKSKRLLSFFLAILMLITAISSLFASSVFMAFADEEPVTVALTSVPHAYIKSGLVALYSGTQNTRDGQDTASTVWEDLVGGHDVTVSIDDKNYFTNNGFHLNTARNFFPQKIVDVVNSDSFTVEILLSDLVSLGSGYNTLMNSDNDNFALFRRNDSDVLEFKFAANAQGTRPQIPDCTNMLQDALITITYRVGGDCIIYINGEQMTSNPATTNMGANNLFFGHDQDTRNFDVLYRSMRFYNRDLSSAEVKHNAVVDGYAEAADLYVTDGLVTMYSGISNTENGYDAASVVWADLVGENDLTLKTDAQNYFTAEGFHLNSTIQQLPTPIVDLVNGKTFTVEIQFGDFVSIGADFNTFLNSSNDNFALFRRNSTNQIEFKYAANANADRPKINDGLNLLDNGLISVTYEVGGKCRIYVNGELSAEMPCPSLMGADDLYIGHDAASKNFEATYRSIRFYDRALTAEEIAANADADGVLVSSGATDATPGYVTVAQPVTNIVGDIAIVRDINTGSELVKIANAKQKPAAAILRVNRKLEVLSDSNVAMATVQEAMERLNYEILPVFYVEDSLAAAAVIEYLQKINFTDASIMSADPAVVKIAREVMPVLRGIIDYTATYADATDLSIEQCLEIRKSLKANNGMIAVLPSALCNSEDVQYLYSRQVNVWARAADTLDAEAQYQVLLSGAVGVISDDTDKLIHVACALPENTLTRLPLNVGHRGTPGSAPENTVEGALLAYEQGADAVELDVYMSADGQVVLMHDGSTGRTCDKDVSVEGSTVAQLKELYVNKGFENTKYAECRIPTLDEFLAAMSETECMLFIEIKSGNADIVPAIKELVEKYDMYDQCAVITFSEGQMANMRRYWPEMHVGALTSGYIDEIDSDGDIRGAMSFIGKYNASINPQYTGYGEKAVRAGLIRGIGINVWTLNTASSYFTYLLNGCSSLTGDYPGNMARFPEQIMLNHVTDGMTVNAGDTIKVDAALIYANRNTKETTASVTILNGSGLVRVDGDTLTFASGKEGTVILVFSSTYKVTNGTYTLFTQPVTLHVTAGGTPETSAAPVSTNTPETSDELETTNMSVSDETTDTSVVTSNRAEKPIDSDRLTDDTGEQNDHGTGTLAADDGCGSVVVGASALALAVVGAVGMMIRKKKIDE